MGSSVEYYCGLDLSLTATGLVVVNGDCEVVSQELITSKEKEIGRVVEIAELVMRTLRSLSVKPAVFMEGYSFGIGRMGQTFSLGELGGVVKAYLHNNGFVWSSIPPTSLKKFITGKGGAKKEQMLLQTYKRYGVEFSDNNLCDAFGLSVMCFKHFRRNNIGKLLQHEEEVFTKLGFRTNAI